MENRSARWREGGGGTMGEGGETRFGAVILAGGQSRRMGTDKAELRLDGVRFLDRLVYACGGLGEVLVSVDDASRHPAIPYPMVSDRIPGCGPLGGLHAALCACASDALVVVPCDLPLFSGEMVARLCAELTADTDVVAFRGADGRAHPLCGVYRKDCARVIGDCLQAGEYRVQATLGRLRVKWIDAGDVSWRLANINTQDDYRRIQSRHLLAVCGWKNAGKTTLIERLIPALNAQGLTVATVKHDGHSFAPDAAETDSARFFSAGALASAVYDAQKVAVISRSDGNPHELLCALSADILLLEGLKRTDYPKLEIVRRAAHGELIAGLQNRIALVSDAADTEPEQDVPVFDSDDVPAIAAFIAAARRDGKLRWEG